MWLPPGGSNVAAGCHFCWSEMSVHPGMRVFAWRYATTELAVKSGGRRKLRRKELTLLVAPRRWFSRLVKDEVGWFGFSLFGGTAAARGFGGLSVGFGATGPVTGRLEGGREVCSMGGSDWFHCGFKGWSGLRVVVAGLWVRRLVRVVVGGSWSLGRWSGGGHCRSWWLWSDFYELRTTTASVTDRRRSEVPVEPFDGERSSTTRVKR